MPLNSIFFASFGEHVGRTKTNEQHNSAAYWRFAGFTIVVAVVSEFIGQQWIAITRTIGSIIASVGNIAALKQSDATRLGRCTNRHSEIVAAVARGLEVDGHLSPAFADGLCSSCTPSQIEPVLTNKLNKLRIGLPEAYYHWAFFAIHSIFFSDYSKIVSTMGDVGG